MTELFGLSLETWRALTVAGMLGTGLLYLYRFVCVVEILKSSLEDKLDKLIYVLVVVFIPLGIGAAIYEHVEKDNKISPLFYIGFILVAVVYVVSYALVLPNATNFGTDYMG